MSLGGRGEYLPLSSNEKLAWKAWDMISFPIRIGNTPYTIHVTVVSARRKICLSQWHLLNAKLTSNPFPQTRLL